MLCVYVLLQHKLHPKTLNTLKPRERGREWVREGGKGGGREGGREREREREREEKNEEAKGQRKISINKVAKHMKGKNAIIIAGRHNVPKIKRCLSFHHTSPRT